MRRCLEIVRPSQVLIEGPIDFEPLIPLLADPQTVPPVAVVMMDSAAADSAIAVYPFCRHSPEFVALVWAAHNGAQARFIDLPSRDKAMRKRADNEGRLPLIANDRLDYNGYVAELCRRRGVADGSALWDALFESQGPGVDWVSYFEAVALYCEHIRQIAAPADIEADGTLAREAHMRRCLSEARSRPGPIVVVTGGFHTPALRDVAPNGSGSPATAQMSAAGGYLVRYGFQQLDQQDGYGAGLPHPAWYDRLWGVLDGGSDPQALALEMVTAFADRLRRTAPGLALPSPVSMQAVAAAHRLAVLRGLPFPGRNEVLDGVRSAGVKEAVVGGRSPLLDALSVFLTGTEVGDLPATAGQPPIIGALRERARELKFILQGGERRTRDLDVLRKPSHAEASRFLYAMHLIGSPFARKLSGPDPLSGWRQSLLIETWSYVWSPMVEQHLLGLALKGSNLEQLCHSVLRERLSDLSQQGLSRNTGAVTGLLIDAARTGLNGLVLEMLSECRTVLGEDPDPGSVIKTLALTQGLSFNLGGDLADAFADFRRDAFARLIQLFPDLQRVPADRMGELTLGLSEIAAMALEQDEAIDLELLAEAAVNQPPDIPPMLEGAMAAFCGLIGISDEAEVARRLAAALAGVYVETGARAQALTGCITVNPRLLINSDAVRTATDEFLGGLDTEEFLSVLPELRLALSQLSPSEIDQVAAWVAAQHGSSSTSSRDLAASSEEVADNLRLSDRLVALWADDGLTEWLEGRA